MLRLDKKGKFGRVARLRSLRFWVVVLVLFGLYIYTGFVKQKWDVATVLNLFMLYLFYFRFVVLKGRF